VVVGFVVDHDDAGMYFSNFKVCIKLQINKFKSKIVKFLNQCFAGLRFWKSVCTAVTVGFVNSRHFSKTEVVQNTDLKI